MNKKIIKVGIILTIIILLIMIIAKIFDLKTIILKKMYPIKYAEYVYKYAEENELDPLLIFSIIKAESNFEETVVSNSGAIGLMQLMEKTAIEQSNKLQKNYEYKDFFNAQINIELGTRYFSELLKKYNNNYNLAITAYNAGIGVVDNWIKEEIIKSDGSDIENIPYRETNNYVRKIFKNYKIYKELYGD